MELKDQLHLHQKYLAGMKVSASQPVSRFSVYPLSNAEAIAYHDGMNVPEGRSVAHKEGALLLLLHWADMWKVSVRERKRQTIS